MHQSTRKRTGINLAGFSENALCRLRFVRKYGLKLHKAGYSEVPCVVL